MSSAQDEAAASSLGMKEESTAATATFQLEEDQAWLQWQAIGFDGINSDVEASVILGKKVADQLRMGFPAQQPEGVVGGTTTVG